MNKSKEENINNGKMDKRTRKYIKRKLYDS